VIPHNVARMCRESLKYVIIALVCFGVFAPFGWLVISSVKDITEVYTPSHIIPHNPTLDNFRLIFKETPLYINFFNSVIVATLTTIITVILGSMAGYGFSRFRFIGNNLLLLFVLVTRLIPPITILIPLYILVRKMNLVDTKTCLILLNTTFHLPTVIWITKVFFDQLPQDLLDGAKIDGCGNLRMLVSIVVPLSIPCLAVASCLTFVGAWNEFLLANTFTNTDVSRTITVGIVPFVNPTAYTGLDLHWGHAAAGTLLTIGPIVFLAAFFQKYLVSGLLAGSLKG